MTFTSGLPGLDKILHGIVAGDNVVLEVDSIDDYLPFVEPFVAAAVKDSKDLIYFRFAQHKELLPPGTKATVYRLHPEEGFETFISEIFDVIEKHGYGACYVFDCLSELAVDWYSDRMLGNFFLLTCPYLYKYATVTYFALIKNYHSAHAIYSIHNTAQVVIEVFRNQNKIYIHPIKVQGRHSSTMYMLHSREGEEFLPVTSSSTVTEIFSRVPQPWLDFTIQRSDVWTQTFMKAQEALDEVLAGKKPPSETDYYFQHILRMIITRAPRILQLAEKYFDLADLLQIRKRMIGTGLIGGKSVGMLLARSILNKKDPAWADRLEAHDSFFIGSDVFYTYLIQNDCWWVRRKQKDPATLLEGADESRQKMLTGKFPDYIKNQIMEMLDYFGQSPIIVRSSSLLEDNYGNAFSGKYESVFCANQGTPEERLENFLAAVRTVYASTMSHEALTYRAHWDLLDKDEQMALLVQRVSGGMYGQLYFPQIAGVGFSFNPYVWNNEIDPKAGMMRLVFGLGTRAVGRFDDDYTRVVALNAPHKRPESNFDEVKKYAQRKVDVLDLNENQLVSRYFEDVVRAAHDQPVDLFISRDEELEKRYDQRGSSEVFSWVLTFDKLFAQTPFISEMQKMMKTLEVAYENPVDIEFTANFIKDNSYRINLLQCRPFQVKGVGQESQMPTAVAGQDLILQTQGPIIGNTRDISLDRIIYIAPSVYGKMKMSDRYTIARLVGKLTHIPGDKKEKNIMIIGPGRWGTTMPALGVPVSFAEINTVKVLCEIAAMHEGLVPDVSVGTHFFNDLVEMDMLYLAIYPDKAGYAINQDFLNNSPNQLGKLLPEEKQWAEAVKVLEPGTLAAPQKIHLKVNALEQKGLCYLV